VKDLGSRNGTFIGDVRVRDALVPIGTRIRIGRTVLSLLDATIAPPEDPLPPPNVPGLVTASATMQEIGRTVERLAQSNVSVLIQGETGTGKELVARAIHDLSARAKRPFIVVDPGALPATLIASQLFGHERGAFTGAERRQEGAFELAHGGAVLPDAIGGVRAGQRRVNLPRRDRRAAAGGAAGPAGRAGAAFVPAPRRQGRHPGRRARH